MTQVHLVGISGSLRSGSYNTALLRAAFDDLPEGVTAEIVSLGRIPLYNQDDEQEHGAPAPVVEIRSAVAAADGIVFATPEYNWSVTGAMKNAVDWLSRGPNSPLDFKPAAIVGGGGGSGTARSQQHLRDVLGHNSLCILAEPQVMVRGVSDRFDGINLVDETVKSDLATMIDRLVELIERSRSTERVDVRGSVLVVGTADQYVESTVRSLTELGYRTLSAFSIADAERILANRTVAAVVLDPGFDETGRRRISGGVGDRPVVAVEDPSTAGRFVDDTLRYGDSPE